MLLTAVFPIADLRAVDGEPPSPSFRADRALRIRTWPGDPGPSDAPGPFRVIFRDLSAEGEVASAFELTLGTPPRARTRLAIARVISSFAQMDVEVRSEGRARTLPLAHAGAALARAHLEATSPPQERRNLRPDLVVAGDPILLVQWCSNERVSDDDLPPLTSLAGDLEGLALGRAASPSLGPRALVWFLRHERPDQRHPTSELRATLARLCVERECLRIVLSHVVDGRLAPPPNDRARSRPPARPLDATRSDRLQLHLRDAVRDALRLQRKVPVPTAQLRRDDARTESRDVGDTFVAVLDRHLRDLDLRPNVRRGLVAWAADDWNVPVPDSPSPPDAIVQPRPRASIRPVDPLPLPDLPTRSLGLEVLRPPQLDLRARLAALGRERVEPGERVPFLLELTVGAPLDEPGPGGATGTFQVPFPDAAEERALLAVVECPDFEAVPGHPLAATFRVRRDGVAPATFPFAVRALGDRPHYALSVHLFLDGSPLGDLTVKLGRSGLPAPVSPSTSGAFTAPPSATGAALVLSVAKIGERNVVTWPRAPGDLAEWELTGDPMLHFNALGQTTYQSRAKLFEYCRKLQLDMDTDLHATLKAHAERGDTVLVTSATPAFPFELVPLGRNQPFLGACCPIARWTDKAPAASARSAVRLDRTVCIRPDYQVAANKLPSAADEEEDLRTWLSDRLTRVADRAAFDLAIERADVDLVHFAGHASDNPLGMKLADREAITPELFLDTPLATARTFFFLNGCRASLAHAELPPSLGNMVRGLLRCGFAGVVAPFITVYSPAARRAAAAFYQEARNGSTVAAAVRAVHALADTDPDQAATYLSYLAYTPPGLRFAPPAGPAPSP